MEFEYDIDAQAVLAPVPVEYWPDGVDGKGPRLLVRFAVLIDDAFQDFGVEFGLDDAVELIEDVERELMVHDRFESGSAPCQVLALGISLGRDGIALLLTRLVAAMDRHEYVGDDPDAIVGPFYEGR